MSRMMTWSAAVVALICCAGVQSAPPALSASPPPVKPGAAPVEHAARKPIEVKVVSMPPASAPVEVKVVSLPASAAPTPVRLVDAPKDESGEKLVASTDRLARATWVLALLTGGVFVYTAVLARTTSRIARSQSDELARRDKDALAREVHRAAHRLRLDAEHARLLASTLVNRRVTVGAMMGGGGGRAARGVGKGPGQRS